MALDSWRLAVSLAARQGDKVECDLSLSLTTLPWKPCHDQIATPRDKVARCKHCLHDRVDYFHYLLNQLDPSVQLYALIRDLVVQPLGIPHLQSYVEIPWDGN